MQQFQVPQFISREAKLIGPLTVKQSAIFTLHGAVLFVMWFLFAKWLFFVVAIPQTLLVVLVAFAKINGRPLIDFFASFFSFFVSPQLYIWQKRKNQQTKKRKKAAKTDEVLESFEGPAAQMTKEKIKELASKLDQ